MARDQNVRIAIEVRKIGKGVEDLRKGFGDLKQGLADLKRQSDDAAKSATRLESGMKGASGALSTLKSAIAGLALGVFVKSIVDATIAFERMQNALQAATGSAEAAAREYQFVREESERLGLDLRTAAKEFAKLAAAAKGTRLEGQETRLLFTAVAEAATALGLSSEETAGALTALQQMINKGRVAAEELRGQLGERLPGASQIAARALGMTTQDLDKMIDTGSIASDEFLPRFSRELHKTFEETLPQATKSAQAELNRFKTALFELQVAFAKSGFMDALIAAVRDLTKALKDSELNSGIKTVSSFVKDIFGDIIKGFSALPDVVKELGVVGAVLFGKKALLVIGALSWAITKAKELVAAYQGRRWLPGAEEMEGASSAQEAIIRRRIPTPSARGSEPGGFTPDRFGHEMAGYLPPFEPTPDPTKLAAIAKAQAEAALSVMKDALDREQRLLDQKLEDFLVSYREYYAEKARLQDAAVAAEIAAKQKELAVAKDAGERAKITAEIIILERRRLEIAGQAAREQARAERELVEELDRVRARLLENEGKIGEARRITIEQEFRKLLKRLEAEGNEAGVTLVRRLINVEAAKADLDELKAQVDRIRDDQTRKEKSVQADLDAGLTTEYQARMRLVEVHKETAKALDDLLPKLKEVAEASGSPEALKYVERVKDEIADLKKVADDVATAVNGAIRDSISQLFEDLISGAKSASEAMRDFAKSVLNSLARIAGNKIADRLFGLLFGEKGTLGSAFSGILKFLGFARGGLVTGPGTDTSDTVPAMLSPGEYVLRADVVRRIGRGFLDALNAPAVPRYAVGGIVDAVPGAAAGGGRLGAAPVRLALSVSPEALHMTLRDWLEGELARIAAGR